MTGDLDQLGGRYGIDPSLIDEVAGDVPQLPLELFGPWARWLDVAATDAGAPSDYVAATLLAGASAVIGNARWVAGAGDGWFLQPAVLWMALVGAPSSGKTPATAAVIDAIKRIDREDLQAWEPERQRREEAIVVARATESAWKDAVTAAVRSGDAPPPMPHDAIVPTPAVPPQILVGDTTGEAMMQIAAASPRGILMYRDELAGLIGGLDKYKAGGSDRAALLEGYGGGEYRIARKSGGANVVPHLSVSVLGGLQPDRFQSLIGRGDDDGLQARFLFVFPTRRPFAGRPAVRVDHVRLVDALRRLRGLQMVDDGDVLKPAVTPLDDVAADSFVRWLQERDAVPPVGTGRFLAWWGKGPGRVLRLALVMTLLEWCFDGLGHPPKVIRDECLARAIFLHDEILAAHARATFADAGLPQAERHARTIARWLAAHAGDVEPSSITIREIYRSRHLGIRTRDEAHAALQVLSDAGWVRAAPIRLGDNPGRKSERFEIPDALWSCLAEVDGE